MVAKGLRSSVLAGALMCCALLACGKSDKALLTPPLTQEKAIEILERFVSHWSREDRESVCAMLCICEGVKAIIAEEKEAGREMTLREAFRWNKVDDALVQHFKVNGWLEHRTPRGPTLLSRVGKKRIEFVVGESICISELQNLEKP